MDKEVRKQLIQDLRKYHEPTFEALGIPAAYFTAKHAHYFPENNTEKCIGLYESEASKGDDVYIEFTTMDYKPMDATRRLYVWKHMDYKIYPVKKEQYMIPVAVLQEVPRVTKSIEWTKEMSLPKSNYTKESEEVKHYITEKYKCEDGTHEITYKNGIPYEYIYISKDEQIGGIKIYAPTLEPIIKFFKTLR